MPNWAQTTMKVIGPKSELKKFLKDMQAATDVNSAPDTRSDWRENWLGNLFIKAGIPEKDWEKYDIHPRGWVEDINDCTDETPPNVEIYYQSANDGRVSDFDIMFKKCYPSLKEISCVSESGMQIYYTTDEEALFFSPYSMYADIEYKGHHFWSESTNEQEILDEFNDCCKTNFKKLSELEQAISIENNKGKDDYFVCQKIDVIFDSSHTADKIIATVDKKNILK